MQTLLGILRLCFFKILFLGLVTVGFRAEAQPVIGAQPVSQTNVTVGATVSFTVGASGSGTLSFQWRRNGVNIPGETKSTIAIANAQPEDGGLYSAVVADSVGATSSSNAKLSFNIQLVAGNTIDHFTNRFNLSGTNGYLKTANFLASAETGEPRHAGVTGGKSIWFRILPRSAGIVTISARGSGLDTLLAAYTGTSVGQLSLVSKTAADDDGGGYLTSEISFNATGDTEYQIAVDGFQGTTGDIILHWQIEATVDLLPNITFMSPSQTVPLGTTNFSFFYGADTGNGLWLHNNLPTAVSQSTYTIAQVDDSSVGRYHVQITSSKGRRVFTVPADLQINFTDGGSDPNVAALDKLLAASEGLRTRGNGFGSGGKGPPSSSVGTSRGYTTTQIFSTVGSTKDDGEPNHCGEPGGASEWFVYQAPDNGTMYVNTEGSTYNTVLAVYTGTGDFSGLTSVGCDNKPGNGGERVWINATSNTLYYIAVDGVGGASGTVHLNVNLGTPPSITASPTNKTVGVGSNATFFVTATGTTPLYYQWKFNNANIAGATNSSYTRIGCQPSHAGSYTVTVSNLVNIVATSSTATLTVLTPPSITTQPTNQTVTAGSSASFNVTAAGSATLRYQWRFNGTNLANATGTTLTLNNVQTGDAGPYSVVVTNTVGTVTSSNATLTVNIAPSISVPPATQTVTPGGNVTLTVTASGSPAPGYQWQFNGGNISAATSSSLTVTNFQSSNEGGYRVIVSNVVGSVMSATATLLANSPLRLGTSYGLTNGNFQLQIVGKSGSNYVLETSTTLTNWTPVFTNSSSNGLINLLDTNTGSFSKKFYRAKSGP